MSAGGAKFEAPKALRGVRVGFGRGVPSRFWVGSQFFNFDLLIAHFDGFSGAKYIFSLYS